MMIGGVGERESAIQSTRGKLDSPSAKIKVCLSSRKKKVSLSLSLSLHTIFFSSSSASLPFCSCQFALPVSLSLSLSSFPSSQLWWMEGELFFFLFFLEGAGVTGREIRSGDLADALFFRPAVSGFQSGSRPVSRPVSRPAQGRAITPRPTLLLRPSVPIASSSSSSSPLGLVKSACVASFAGSVARSTPPLLLLLSGKPDTHARARADHWFG